MATLSPAIQLTGLEIASALLGSQVRTITPALRIVLEAVEEAFRKAQAMATALDIQLPATNRSRVKRNFLPATSSIIRIRTVLTQTSTTSKTGHSRSRRRQLEAVSHSEEASRRPKVKPIDPLDLCRRILSSQETRPVFSLDRRSNSPRIAHLEVVIPAISTRIDQLSASALIRQHQQCSNAPTRRKAAIIQTTKTSLAKPSKETTTAMTKPSAICRRTTKRLRKPSTSQTKLTMEDKLKTKPLAIMTMVR